jgi:hypothetical protein
LADFPDAVVVEPGFNPRFETLGKRGHRGRGAGTDATRTTDTSDTTRATITSHAARTTITSHAARTTITSHAARTTVTS